MINVPDTLKFAFPPEPELDGPPPSWPVAITIALLIAATLMLVIGWTLDVPASDLFGGPGA